ncbi:hypothetical protein EVAR_23648_1 [Eumeta japonica]|uniref:Uncharacterized protein n=1 Tax=Eumeta variegata TaxID=151549 RepID=A0A4C1VIF7_EUMVA|nr:hypothetical protein EVAR_23648_1 [Eumeta japonica]
MDSRLRGGVARLAGPYGARTLSVVTRRGVGRAGAPPRPHRAPRPAAGPPCEPPNDGGRRRSLPRRTPRGSYDPRAGQNLPEPAFLIALRAERSARGWRWMRAASCKSQCVC